MDEVTKQTKVQKVHVILCSKSSEKTRKVICLTPGGLMNVKENPSKKTVEKGLS